MGLILDNTYRGLSSIVFVVRVEGESCWPCLVHGKEYWATCLLRPKRGDFVVFRNPKDRKEIFVKKVTAVEGGHLKVASTVSWGSPSIELGVVPQELVMGTIFRSSGRN